MNPIGPGGTLSSQARSASSVSPKLNSPPPRRASQPAWYSSMLRAPAPLRPQRLRHRLAQLAPASRPRGCPAAFIASIFSAAVPLPPEMMAPAWPMRRPGGAVRPAMKPTTGFLQFALIHAAAVLLGVAADLADHQHGVGLRVGRELLQHVDEVGAVDRIAADADAGGLAEARGSRAARPPRRSACPSG